MITQGYSHIALNVSDMEREIDFYCKVLGFKRAFNLPHPETGKPWVVYLYTFRNQFLELFHGGVNQIGYEKTNIGFSHLCIETEDIERTAKLIEEAGWELDRPAALGCDGNWQCWIHDPDGNRIEIMQIMVDSQQGKFLEQLKQQEEKEQ